MLVVQARNKIDAGNLEDAKRLALEADELGVSYDVFDDRPELLLADIDRRLKTTTFARNSGQKSTNADGVRTAGDSSPAADMRQGANANDSDTAKKQRALKLLAQARKDLDSGNLESAQAKAEEAQQLNVAFKLFEDMPEIVLNEIEDRRATENVARHRRKPAESQPASEATQAKQLVTRARKALDEGRTDEARELAQKADQLNVAFDLFADNPEMLLNDIARSEAKGAKNPQQRQAEAIALLREARQFMREGHYEEARAKALSAEAMEVALPVTADSPDLVIADLDKIASSANIASNVKSSSNKVTTANNMESDSSRRNNVVASGTRQRSVVSANASGLNDSNEITEFGNTGLSASELYNRGMTELKRGKRENAYLAFKAAHDSGQRLHPVLAQRLNDYLRELAPRTSRGGIQLANSQQEVDSEMTPIDAAQKEQLVKVERIRAEVLNAVFKAERLKESEPKKALELIDQTLSKVESAELSTETVAPLMKQLNRTRTVLRSYIEQQAPNITLKEENERVKDRIKGEVENAIRIDQEMVQLVDKYNDLYKQQRYAEAVVEAKKAQVLNPKDPTVVTMLLKAKFALQD